MENISQMSLLEVALKIMEEKNEVVNIYDLIQEVLKLKGLEDPDGTYTTQLYVDITTSSKFVYMGDDNWDLKSRQSLDQFDKDGAFFNPRGTDFEDDEDEDDEDLDESDIDEDDDDEDDDEESDDEDEDDEESDESDDYEDETDEEDYEESDDDNSIDEDKYNEYMDDYEDLYEN